MSRSLDVLEVAQDLCKYTLTHLVVVMGRIYLHRIHIDLRMQQMVQQVTLVQ